MSPISPIAPIWTSYAQNGEDVMLRRVYPEQTPGFYVDVGAYLPTEDSVTRHFYDRGWCGINVEPNEAAFAELVAARPRDVNLCIALGAAPGRTDFYEVPDRGLSTCVEAERARILDEGYEIVHRSVEVRRLADVCAEHVGDRSIDFMKIDVEGAEADVIRGGDWRRFRPRVLLVEATRPNSSERISAEWEPWLAEHGYRAVYFDGLNLFLLPEEHHASLASCFAPPPNVFDRFERDALAAERERRWQAEAEVRALEAGRLQAEAEIQALEARLRDVFSSRAVRTAQALRHGLARLGLASSRAPTTRPSPPPPTHES